MERRDRASFGVPSCPGCCSLPPSRSWAGSLVWNYAQKLNQAAEQELTVEGKPEPVVADQSIEFETVTDRTPLEFRDNAAYSLLAGTGAGPHSRTSSPPSPGATSCSRISGRARNSTAACRSTCWVPPCACCDTIRSSARKDGSTKHGSSPRKQTKAPYVCVFEDAPEGFPIGPNVSERVVFNGYFLKIMKYQAADTARGAPVLVGRIGWQPSEPAAEAGRKLDAALDADHSGHACSLPRSFAGSSSSGAS